MVGPAYLRLGSPIIHSIPCSRVIDLMCQAATLDCVDAVLEYILAVTSSLDVVAEDFQACILVSILLIYNDTDD